MTYVIDESYKFVLMLLRTFFFLLFNEGIGKVVVRHDS
jgi:hypothetical protein